MTYTEEVLVFSCVGDTLLGILTRPEYPADTGIVLIVGGPQYRAGSHRQFVLLARALAAAGYAVLRFDHRGMGDSEGTMRDYEAISADLAAAIAVLQTQVPTVKRMALWGLCGGATAALLYMLETRDTRVTNLCLLNPWVRSDVSFARTQVKHYYGQRLRQKEFWLKLLQGGVAFKAMTGLLQNIHQASKKSRPLERVSHASYPQRMAAAWHMFNGSILLLLSGEDLVAREFLVHINSDAAWKNAWQHPQLIHHDLPGVDHTFSNADARAQVTQLTLNWLEARA